MRKYNIELWGAGSGGDGEEYFPSAVPSGTQGILVSPPKFLVTTNISIIDDGNGGPAGSPTGKQAGGRAVGRARSKHSDGRAARWADTRPGGRLADGKAGRRAGARADGRSAVLKVQSGGWAGGQTGGQGARAGGRSAGPRRMSLGNGQVRLPAWPPGRLAPGQGG